MSRQSLPAFGLERGACKATIPSDVQAKTAAGDMTPSGPSSHPYRQEAWPRSERGRGRNRSASRSHLGRGCHRVPFPAQLAYGTNYSSKRRSDHDRRKKGYWRLDPGKPGPWSAEKGRRVPLPPGVGIGLSSLSLFRSSHCEPCPFFMHHGETGDGDRNGLFCARDRTRVLVSPSTSETQRLRRTLWVTAPYCMTTGLTGPAF